MATEIWTAKEKTGEGADELIVFDVLDKETKQIRREERYTAALPLMMEQGGVSGADWSYASSQSAAVALYQSMERTNLSRRKINRRR